jgi:hypothetical protein
MIQSDAQQPSISHVSRMTGVELQIDMSRLD